MDPAYRYIRDRVAQGWLQRVAMATQPRLQTHCAFCFAPHAITRWVSMGADTGRKVGPMTRALKSIVTLLLGDAMTMDEICYYSLFNAIRGHTNMHAGNTINLLRRTNTNHRMIIYRPQRAKIHQLKNCLILGRTHRTTSPPDVLFDLSRSC